MNEIKAKTKKKIIIAGGGFAGLQLAKNLNRSEYDVLLVDRQNHHQFQPLFYQVASSRLDASTISFPFRKIFQKYSNLNFILGEIKEIKPDENVVVTTRGELFYDYLVLATGCDTNYFGNDEMRKNCLPMKTTGEAIEIRNRILMGFEDLFSLPDADNSSRLNLVIVGAGATGVELAGAFAEMKKSILPKDYPGIDFSKFKILLLEGSANTLNNMSTMARNSSRKYLKELGVTIMTEVFVTAYDGTTLTLSNNTTIQSRNVIWSAGVKGNIVQGLGDGSITRSNRYIVDRYNKVAGYRNIYAVGDIAYMETPKYPKGHPQVANVAINQGKNLADNLKKNQKGTPLKEFEYFDMGSMATIGKHRAVVDLPFMKFNGYFAWFIWMFLHLMLILSVRNKLLIFINWAWFYLTHDSSLRLIIVPPKKNRG